MMSVCHPLRRIFANSAQLTLCGVLLVSLETPSQARAKSTSFWHNFIQRLTPEDGNTAHIATHPPTPTITPSPVKLAPTTTAEPALTAPIALSDDDKQTQQTLTAALNFMIPRLLTAHTPQTLCLWGMQALLQLQSTANISQPKFTLTLHSTRLTLLHGTRIAFSELTPSTDDILGWSQISTRFIAALHYNFPELYPQNDGALLTSFLNGLLSKLDPYSRYLPPDHTNTSPSAETPFPAPASIGVTLRPSHTHFPIVSAINLNSPLWDAGITPGDRLISLNRRSTRKMTVKELQNLLTGPTGSTVKLGFRLQDGQHLTRSFTRSIMAEESVFPDHIGPLPILHITYFSNRTAEEISQYLSTFFPNSTSESDLSSPPPLQTRPMPLPGLILDLRGNHGGILQQAVMTAALFLNHGIIATTEGRATESSHVWSIQGGDLTNNTSLALLVDKDTGSAAEVLAAALADHRRAVIIGSTSFGKGMVQISSTLPNAGHLTLTWARITAPQGWPLQNLGVIPQLCTSPNSQFSLKDQLSALRDGHSLLSTTLQNARSLRENSPLNTRLSLRAVCPPAPSSPHDLSTAQILVTTPQLYQAALLSVPDINSPPLPSQNDAAPPSSPTP